MLAYDFLEVYEKNERFYFHGIFIWLVLTLLVYSILIV